MRAAGKHTAEAVAAVRDAGVQALVGGKEAGAAWEGQLGTMERLHARGEAAMSELHGRLMAARLEVEASTGRAEELSRKCAAATDDAASRQRLLDQAKDQAFHNHCLLAKLLLNTKRRPANVLVSELYEEIVAKEVPLNEWPNWIVMRMSGGEPLSGWL